MLENVPVGHALAYALKRASCSRGAVNLGYFTEREQADFHSKCEELGVPTVTEVLNDLRRRHGAEAAS